MTSCKRSFVWQYFSVCENENKTKAKCNLCNTYVSRGGVGRTATTTALNNHLKRKHPSVYPKPKDADFESKEINVNVPDDLEEPCISHAHGIKRKQQTLVFCFEKKKLWDISDKNATELHYAIGEMIAVDNQPYSIVNDIGFINLMKKAQPKYQIPCSKYFKEVIISDIYKKCKDKILSEVSNAKTISLTSDIWTSCVNNHSFISLTCHWISDDFELKDAVISAKYFPGSHTGQNICKILQELNDEWNILERLHLLIRDSGPNIVKASKDMNINSKSCFLHNLQLVVNDGLGSQRAINDIIANARKIVTHFSHSPLACSNFKDIQVNELNVAPKKLLQDVKTRWNSTYYMLERLLEQKKTLSLFCTEFGGIINLKVDQWSTIESILRLLQPFEEITKIISNKQSLISEVIPTVSTLIHYLEKDGGEFFGVSTMKETLTKGLAERFSEIYDDEFYFLATILDPRFKTAFFKDETTTNKVKNLLKGKMQHIIINKLSEITESSQSQSFDKKDSLSQKVHSSFWECFAEIAKSEKPSTENDSLTSASDIKALEELNSYILLPLLSRKDNPLVWWKENHNRYPTLSKLIKKYLSAPASSVYSERLFSEAGQIYEQKRNRLQPENGEKLLFLHHNLPILNFDYK